MMADEGEERVMAAYRRQSHPPCQIKEKYDPTNLFRVNQNVRPAP